MNPFQALTFILSEYNHSILNHKQRVAAMLKDLCPTNEHLRAINLLILALNERIPDELIKQPLNREMLEIRLIRRLEDAYGIPYELAQQTILHWSNAIYGIIQPITISKNNFKNIQKRALQGDADAQCEMGKVYLNGHNHIQQNFHKAIKYFNLAIQQNHAIAKNNLGCCYEYGYGVECNYEEATKWYQLSAQQNYSLAQYNLARCYEHGIGVEQNDILALQWYQLASIQGDADAQYHLAWYYLNGDYIEQNLLKASELYHLAAQQGHILAQFNLAYCYEYGKGVQVNLLEAEKWYYHAAKQGDQDAKLALERIKS